MKSLSYNFNIFYFHHIILLRYILSKNAALTLGKMTVPRLFTDFLDQLTSI